MFFAYHTDAEQYNNLVILDEAQLDTLSRVAVSAEIRRKANIVLGANPASLALALARAS